MAEVNLTPELRFPDFENGIHTQDYLFKFCEVNPINGELPEKFIYIDLESVNAGRLEKENEINKDQAPSRAQRILAFGDILYQTVRPYQRNNYHFKLEGDYVASTGYAQIRNPDCPEYYYQLFHTDKFVNEVLRRCTGTSYPAINSTDLEKIPIIVPQPEEQQKIASFLTAVDERIQLLQQKKAKLEEYKKGVMQQLFSQQIRFKDENGNDFPDWEEKKLGGLATISKGKQLNRSELTETGEYPCQNGGIDPSGFTHQYNTEANTITISEGGNSCGYVNFMETRFWCGGHCYALINIKNSVVLGFLFQSLKFNQNDLMRLRVGSGLPNIQKGDVTNFKIAVPSKKEQIKIATFLSSIDNIIDSLAKEVEGTTVFKKGLLQKMFV